MKVVNMFAGPGAGKSTTAALLFGHLKLREVRTELVKEYAKELTYVEKWGVLQDQHAVFHEQLERQELTRGKVDILVTDSPLLLSLVYDKTGDTYLKKKVLAAWEAQDNLNVFVVRTKSYQQYGRSQSLVQARHIDDLVLDLLARMNQSPIRVEGDEDAPHKIIAHMENIGWL